jgi:hypothetical protein
MPFVEESGMYYEQCTGAHRAGSRPATSPARALTYSLALLILVLALVGTLALRTVAQEAVVERRLFGAALAGDVRGVRAALDAGASSNAVDPRGSTVEEIYALGYLRRRHGPGADLRSWTLAGRHWELIRFSELTAEYRAKPRRW